MRRAPKRRPRHLVHRGSVEVHAFLVDSAGLGRAHAEARVLEAWTPGAQVRRNGETYLLSLPRPRRISCSAAPGTPLVRDGDYLTGAPITEEELASLDAPKGAIILVAGGEHRVLRAEAGMVEDPAGWIDTRGFTFDEGAPLGERPRAAPMALAPISTDVRAAFGGAVKPQAPEAAEAMAAVKAMLAGKAAPGARPGAPAAAGGDAPWFGALREAAAKLLGWLAGIAEGLAGRSNGASAAGGAPPRTPAPAKRLSVVEDTSPPGERWLDRLSTRLRQLAARALMVTNLASFVGRRQAEYLGRMMEMFERGQLEDALRHAIPLAKGDGEPPGPPSFGVPSPRQALLFGGQKKGGGTGIAVGPDLFAELRRLYRLAFQKLEREGRVKEAAFVLSELLEEHEEAVTFLERHGELRLAAELAEMRKLAPGLVVRQWFLAGERERAVILARRTGAFADAVLRLERGEKKEAARLLRVLWADSLASSGDYAAAVAAIWPVEDARPLAARWIDLGIEAGGPGASRLLVKKLTLVPGSFEEVRDKVDALLAGESDEESLARLAFGEALAFVPATPESRVLARLAVRSMLRDAGRGQIAVSRTNVERLVTYANDGALRVDTKSLTLLQPLAEQPLVERGTVERAVFAAHDSGTLELYDAASCHDGKVLVALGEAGAKLIGRDGRTLRHFDMPAHRLVLSDHKDRAIAIAPRGDYVRLARLDLITGRAEDWCSAEIHTWARDYDGSMWFTTCGTSVTAVDATAKRFEALWRVGDVGGPAVSIARSASKVAFVVRGDPSELWSYELPSLILRGRARMPAEDPKERIRLGVGPTGRVVSVHHSIQMNPESTWDEALWLTRHTEDGRAAPKTRFPVPHGSAPAEIVVGASWAVARVLIDHTSSQLYVFDLAKGDLHAVLSFQGTSAVRPKLEGDALVSADERGRLVTFDLVKGRVTRNQRL